MVACVDMQFISNYILMSTHKEHVLVEAKTEYTKELISILLDPVCSKMDTLYDSALQSSSHARDVLIAFQRRLKEIPLWNQAQIDTEVTKVSSRCEWINDLIAAIFISNVKILTSVKIGKDKKKIQIKMPKLDQFVHKIYITTAKSLYNNPFVYQSANRHNEVDQVVKQCIEDTIRTMLPFQNILQSYLGDLTNPIESESESESDEDILHDSVVEDDNCSEDDECIPKNTGDGTGDMNDVLNDVDSELPTMQPTVNQQPNQQPVQGFFDKPPEAIGDEETKTVPVVTSNPQHMKYVAPQQNIPSESVLFPDAIDDM